MNARILSFSVVLALLFAPVIGQGANLYFDADGAVAGFGAYGGTSLSDNLWSTSDTGISATASFAGAGGTNADTAIFTVDANTWTGNGQVITIGSFDLGGIQVRGSGSTENRTGLNNGTLNFQSGAVVDIADVSSQGGDWFLTNFTTNGDFTKTGDGGLEIRDGTINGTWSIQGGQLRVDADNDYGISSVIDVESTGSANLAGNRDITIGGVTGTGPITGGGGGSGTDRTVTFTTDQTLDFGGTYADHPNSTDGVRNFVMNGTGEQSFSGTVTIEGTTTVDAGTFAIDGTHENAGAYTVNGGTLAGSGTIDTSGGQNADANVTVNAGGQLAPGRDGTVGTLTLTLGNGTLDLTNVGTGGLLFDLGGTTDLVQVNSSITISGLEFADFTFTELAGLTDGTYDLFTSSSLVGALGAGTTGLIGSSFTGELQTSGSNLQLVVATSVIPEPGAGLMVAICVGWILVFQRRRS